MLCCECRQVLSDEEIEYLENRCVTCEQEWLNDIEAWRHGAENPKFDNLFSAPEETRH